jgi:hypothetical protein
LQLLKAPAYLNLQSTLPGFKSQDPSSIDLDTLGPEYSRAVVYTLEDPFQTTYAFMAVATGPVQTAAAKAELRDEAYLERQFLQGIASGGVSSRPRVTWSSPSIGTSSKLGKLQFSEQGLAFNFEILVIIEERSPDAALIFVGSLYMASQQRARVDIQDVGKRIVENIRSGR